MSVYFITLWTRLELSIATDCLPFFIYLAENQMRQLNFDSRENLLFAIRANVMFLC